MHAHLRKSQSVPPNHCFVPSCVEQPHLWLALISTKASNFFQSQDWKKNQGSSASISVDIKDVRQDCLWGRVAHSWEVRYLLWIAKSSLLLSKPWMSKDECCEANRWHDLIHCHHTACLLVYRHHLEILWPLHWPFCSPLTQPRISEQWICGLPPIGPLSMTQCLHHLLRLYSINSQRALSWCHPYPCRTQKGSAYCQEQQDPGTLPCQSSWLLHVFSFPQVEPAFPLHRWSILQS